MHRSSRGSIPRRSTKFNEVSMVGIITNLADGLVSPEDAAYTQMVFRPVWEKQGMELEQGYIKPKDVGLLDAVETKRAKKLTQFIDEIKMFAGDNWKTEMVAFRDAALIQFRLEEEKEVIIKDFEQYLDTIDWKSAVLSDNSGNSHTIVAVSPVQVVTQCMDSYFVWHKQTGESMMLGCDELRIVTREKK